jgi:hypothetical protein
MEEASVMVFKEVWKLKDVLGSPSSTAFWDDADIRVFAFSHVLQSWDTLESLVVKYCVQVSLKIFRSPLNCELFLFC